MHFFVALLFPGGLILAAAAVAILIESWRPWLTLVGTHGPLALLVLSFLLGWRFNRSRLVYGVLLLFLADRLLLAGTAAGGAAAQASFWLLAVALPVNFLLLSLLRERGLFTPLGGCRLLAIAVQAGLVGYLALQEPAEVVAQLAAGNLALPFGFFLSVPVALILLVAAVVICWRFARHRDPLEHGIFWALAAVGVALAVGSPLASCYLAVAGLVLLVGAMESAHGMAFRDELTGLPGRRALNEAMLRLRGDYTVAMVDVDHFKNFNDQHGHDIGDQVLRMVAGKLRQVRGGGKAFRYGGEEFTILFSGKGREEAMPHLEAVREQVAAARFRLRGAKRPGRKPKAGKSRSAGRSVAVTVSIGVATRQQGKKHRERTVQAADKALYRAKEAGRNRVAT
ncbi:MAG: GGDEF domain-containing protein [Thermodesulfobacteriota bacterium]